jgi:peroxiredoxin
MARRLQVGDPAPDFTLPLLDGGTVSLSDYRDRPLILLFTRWLG